MFFSAKVQVKPCRDTSPVRTWERGARAETRSGCASLIWTTHDFFNLQFLNREGELALTIMVSLYKFMPKSSDFPLNCHLLQFKATGRLAIPTRQCCPRLWGVPPRMGIGDGKKLFSCFISFCCCFFCWEKIICNIFHWEMSKN